MFSELFRHPRALAASLVFHLLVFAAILFNFHFSDRTPLVKQADTTKTVKAEIVDNQRLEARELEKKKQQDAKRQRELDRQKREQEKKQQQEAEKKRKQDEARRAAEAKKQAEIARQEKAAEEQRKKEEAEQQKKREEAEEQKKREEAERELKEQLAREAEQKRLEEEKLRQEAEQRRLAEEAQERRQQELNARLEAEESQRRLDSLRDAYRLAIKQKIERNWRQPQESVKMPDCEVRVTQGPGGIILNVSFGRCQGGTNTYRLSIENAVYKAEPLPLPGDDSLFERELIILFNPG